MKLLTGNSPGGLEELVLFPFDDYSFPFQKGVELELVSFGRHGGDTNLVLGLGPEGSPDSRLVSYYGTVCRVGEELFLWYLGQGADPGWHQRVCFATSRDGKQWEKPQLGLVEYKGSRRNNLVDLNGGRNHVQACVVFYEPEDPDSDRRFKMVFESNIYENRFAVAFSPDGLRWKESSRNPVGDWLEMAGGTKYNGTYHLNGQGGVHSGRQRQFATHLSYNFEDWTDATCRSLKRAREVSSLPLFAGRHAGEQIHLGAALWNRGNVLLGIFGLWNGHPASDRRLLSMDLGLAVSSDGLHFREPVPDFPIVRAAEIGYPRPAEGPLITQPPALIQGQGFENIGEETLFWYGRWPEHNSNGVRLATWERDRLGCFKPFRGPRMQTCRESHFVSAPIDLEGDGARLLVNADGISDHSGLTFEVLDEQFQVREGYQAADCLPLVASGLRQPVSWKGRETIESSGGPIRLKVGFSGLRPEDARVYALYLERTQKG